MAAREEDDDPAIYGSGPRRVQQDSVTKPSNGDDSTDEQHAEDENDEEEDDDSTLLTVQPGFNRLLLVLRDPGVLHFVKYISAQAPGSRWDICGEWEIGHVEEDVEEGDGVDSEDNGGYEGVEETDEKENS